MATNLSVEEGSLAAPLAGGPSAASAGAGAAGGGATGKLIGIVVVILAVLALVGGVVAWLVLRPHSDSTTTEKPAPHIVTTTTLSPEDVGGENCVEADYSTGDCHVCKRGYVLSRTPGDRPAERGNEARCFYKCESDLTFPTLVKSEQKGLCLDDTTFEWCAQNVPFHWPNTNEPVKSLRMFKAWQGGWTDPNNPWNDRHKAWDRLESFVKQAGARVLVGTQVTCDPASDDEDWANVLTMIQQFGVSHIMGVAIGNEMELYFQKNLTDADGHDIWNECMNQMWNPQPVSSDNLEGQPYFIRVFLSRLADLDALGGGFELVPVTSVFGGAVFAGQGSPFVEIPWAPNDCHSSGCPTVGTVTTFLKAVVPRVGPRWRWVLNIYPYFNPGWQMDADGIHCNAALQHATCFNHGQAQDCDFSGLVALMRQRMASFQVSSGGAGGGFKGPLWVGETGWSAPKSDTLSSAVQACEDFSSIATFEKYYRKFLEWDMVIPQVYNDEHAEFLGPDHVFWFTSRDSSNFDKKEHFGLIGDGAGESWCTNTTCKLNERGVFTTTPTTTTVPYTGPSTTSTTTTSTTSTTITTTTTTHAFRGQTNCCYNKWGCDDLSTGDHCCYYPGGGQGLCNNGWSHRCQGEDAEGICRAITTTIPTTPGPTTTKAATTPPSTTKAATTPAVVTTPAPAPPPPATTAAPTPPATTAAPTPPATTAAPTPPATTLPASETEIVL